MAAINPFTAAMVALTATIVTVSYTHLFAFFMFEAGKITKGDGIKYNNLKSLLETSSSARKYFLSLPVSLQITLHSQNRYIHSI